MFPNLNPHAVGIVGLDLRGLINLVKCHGFAGVDPPLSDPDGCDAARRAADMARDAGLRWGGFGLPVEFRRTEDEYRESIEPLRRLILLADACDCRRCTTWLMPCHDSLNYDDNFELHVRRLSPVAALLADRRIRLGLEFVGPRTLRQTASHPFVHTIDQCLELSDAIGHDCGVLLDSFHWHTSHADEKDIVQKLADRIVYVHVNDGIRGRSPDEQIDQQRALPCDTGVIDLPGFIRGLRAVGYGGPIGVEPFMPELRQQDAGEVAARAYESLRRLGVG